MSLTSLVSTQATLLPEETSPIHELSSLRGACALSWMANCATLQISDNLLIQNVAALFIFNLKFGHSQILQLIYYK